MANNTKKPETTKEQANTQEPEKKLNEAEVIREEMSMKSILENEPKVRIKIPVSEKDNAPVPVCFNGVKYEYKRGVTYDVPQTIADVLEYSKYI